MIPLQTGMLRRFQKCCATALVSSLENSQGLRFALMCALPPLHARRLYRFFRFAPRFILIFSSIFFIAGCATISPRNVLPQSDASQIELEGFHNIRFWGDASVRDIRATVLTDGPRAETQTAFGAEKYRPVSNLLAISGGAQDGAFGAGLLVGWSDSGTRPVFDLVTGVSSGALIAPFAYLGSERDNQLREIFTKYERKDIFTYNVPSLLEGSALVDDAPLARLIEFPRSECGSVAVQTRRLEDVGTGRTKYIALAR